MQEEFFAAIQGGDRSTALQLLETKPSLMGRRAPSGHSPLRLARECGHADLARALGDRAAELDAFDALAAGDISRFKEVAASDVDRVSHDGWTLLHLAAFYGEAEAVRWLLDEGASIEAVSRNGSANQPLHAALAGVGNAEVIDLLIEAGADLGFTGGGGVTPLHLAAARGDSATAERLLAHDVDPEAETSDGKTAADLAGERGHRSLAALLRDVEDRA